MALVLKDRVRETSTSTGTGAFTLAGAVAGFQSFSAVGTGNQTYYTIAGTTDWEVGIGTWTSPDQLSRDTVLASTNAGALVTFGSGTKDVFLTFPAEGFAVPPAIGGTTPNAITATTVTVNSAIYLPPVVNIGTNTGIIQMMDGGDGYDYPNFYSTDGFTNYGVNFPYGLTASSISGVGTFTANLIVSFGELRGADLQFTGPFNYVNIYPHQTSGISYTLYLPYDSGSANQVLKTDGSGNLSWTTQGIQGTAPVTVTTATHTVAATTQWIIGNNAGTITLTLPTASTNTGRSLNIKTIQAQTVVSASSNVVPLNGGAAGTAILAATIGKYATLVSDGTNWIIMQAN